MGKGKTEPAETFAEPIEQPATAMVKSIDTERLLTLAVQEKSSIETLERFMAMRTQLKAEAAKEAFLSAMSGFQADCPVISKSMTAGKGSRFTYNYTPLETIKPAIQPPLVKHGLSYRLEYEFPENGVVATCIVSHRDGHSEKTAVRIPIDKAASMNDSQKVGAACSYAGRYALVGALGLVCGNEDDDGHGIPQASNGALFSKPAAIPPAEPPTDRAALMAELAEVIDGRDQAAVDFLMSMKVLKEGQTIADLPTGTIKKILNGSRKAFLDGVARLDAEHANV